ncbi:MAG: NADPH:quinone oxidoreductase family protein [Bacteroidota bacterium]
MKALICRHYGSITSLVFEDTSIPRIGDDEVLIEVSYAGVNFPDVLIVEGKYQFKPELPFVPGGEVSGKVIATGHDVKSLKVGDIVATAMGWGGFAQFVAAKASNTFKLPSEDYLREGAVVLETYGTAIHALVDRAQLQEGETLAVLGASGGTGIAAIQIGKVLGAKVIAIASTKEKLMFARDSGADHQINYVQDDLKEELKSLGGVDVIFDPVGGSASEPAFRSLNPFGRHLVVGFASGEIPKMPWHLPLLKSASIVGVFWGQFWRNYPERNRKNIEQVFDWIDEGKLKPKITREFTLSDGIKALKELKERKVTGKIVLKV